MNKAMWLLRAMLLLSLPVAAATAPVEVDSDYNAYQRPTSLVRIDRGRSISWICMGVGAPTVILMAGAGDWSAAWRKVQARVGEMTRVCAWDRAGFGFSSPSRAVQDIAHTERDLEKALSVARIPAPYVMVGHSLGAFETLRFADRNLRQVAGLVLVDPAFPDQFRSLATQYPGVFTLQAAINAQNAHDLRTCSDGIRGGSIRPGTSTWSDCMNDDPAYPVKLRAGLSRLSRDYHRSLTELSFTQHEFADAQQIINNHRDYRNIPMVVLTATVTPDLPPSVAPPQVAAQMTQMQGHLWMEAHDRLALLSSRGANISVPGATHYVQIVNPQIVSASITRVVSEARETLSRKRPISASRQRRPPVAPQTPGLP